MKKDKGLISVIVPVYNVENYIEKGIQSLLGQTYENIEVILVDDGSTDRSGEICDRYAWRDGRVRVFHVKNGGQSRARNIGLSAAKGTYIGFMDSDDYADTSMYEALLMAMEESSAEIAECDFDGRKSKPADDKKYEKLTVMSAYDAIKDQLDIRNTDKFPSTSVWSKLFKRSVVEGISFPDGKIHEEFQYLCEAFLRAEKYVYINEIYYHRTLREDSTTAMKFTPRAFDKADVYRMRNEFLRREGYQELCKLSEEQEYILLLHYYGECVKNEMPEQEKEILKYLTENKSKIKLNDLPSNKARRFRLFFLFPGLYRVLIKHKR